MKKILLLCSLALTGVLGATIVSCGGEPATDDTGNDNNNDNTNTGDTFDASKNIVLYSRESGSGTRECFFEGIGYGDVKKEDKWNEGVVVSSQSSNAAIMQNVGSNEYGLGYCSLDSIDTVSTIKGLTYEGVKATQDTVVDGTYKLQRNFNFVVASDDVLSAKNALAKNAFVAFMTKSREGLSAIAAEGGILTTSVAKAQSWKTIQERDFANIKDIDGVTINACGSTSVLNVLNGLARAFEEQTGCIVTPNQNGSGDAVKGVLGQLNNKQYEIGFLSREIEAGELEKLNKDKNVRGAICKDAVVPIVNAKNTKVTNVTAEVLVKAYKGEVKTWQAFIDALAA